MKERPILFSGPMVHANLANLKTQTRREVNPQPPALCSYVINGAQSHALCYATISGHSTADARWVHPTGKSKDHRLPCPYGQPGDRLWVKETWGTRYDFDGLKPRQLCNPAETKHGAEIYCAADYSGAKPTLVQKWRPSLFMRRWMSRLLLEITEVRVERLNDISAADAAAEGHPRRADIVSSEVHADAARDWYMDLWECINGPGSWAKNPWVWVITYRRVEA